MHALEYSVSVYIHVMGTYSVGYHSTICMYHG